MNKKILSMLVLGTMILQIGEVNVCAKDNNIQASVSTVTEKDNSNSIYTKEKIEKVVREKLNLSADLKLTSANLELQDSKLKKVWRLNFNSKNNYLNVGVYADTGEIVTFEGNNKIESNVIKIKEDDAKQKAIDFIKYMEPDKMNQVEEVKYQSGASILYKMPIYSDSNSYTFMYARKVNGEFMPSNYFLVKVSGVTGKVTSYTCIWDDVTYDSGKATIDENAARKIFENEDNLKLKYIRYYGKNSVDNDKEEIPTLIPVYYYDGKESGKINARDGKLYKQDEIYNWSYYVGPYYRGDYNAKATMMQEVSKSLGGVIETTPEEGVISKEKAESILLDSITKSIGVDLSDVKPQNSYYAKNSFTNNANGKYWNIYMQNKDASKNVNALIDALTGKITYISYIDSNEKGSPKTDSKNINKENVTKEVLNKINPLLKLEEIGDNEVKLKMTDIPKDFDGILNFTSPRYINEIPYNDNSINISYNVTTGKITSFTITWDKVNAKYSTNLINKEEVQKKFFDTVGIEKYLIQLADKDKDEKDNLEVPLKETVPVYSLKAYDFSYISALDENILDALGNKYENSENVNAKFDDIDNSKWKDEINFMNQMGKIQEKSGKFNPDGVLLKKDAIKWIVNLGLNRQYDSLNEKTLPSYDEKPEFNDLDKNDPYYTYAESAWRMGIIDKDDKSFKGDSVVTKMDVAKWIINDMGLKRLASGNIFKTNYDSIKGVNNKDMGYAALSEFYGIFDDKDFDAGKNFSRDEFIGSLYNFLSKQ